MVVKGVDRNHSKKFYLHMTGRRNKQFVELSI